MMGFKAKHLIDIVAVIPPPLTGMTSVSQAVIKVFDTRARVWSVRNHNNRQGLVWTLAKHLRLSWNLLRAGFAGRGRGTCYFVPDASSGLWLNLLEAPLLRFGFREVWLHHHVFSYIHKKDWRMQLVLTLIGRKVRHIALGESMAAGLRSQYGAQRIHLLGNAIFVGDLQIAKPREVLRTIGFLGNITRDKGIGLFMETLRALDNEGGQLNAVIAGPVCDSSRLKAEIDAFVDEAPDRRRAPGPLHGEAKQAFFKEIDLLLFPSIYANEALPVTIYEALRAGVPVLATQRGCIPDQLEGLGWALPEETFALEAKAIIDRWFTSPEDFTAASSAASARFTEQQRVDRAALDTLIMQSGT